jgi:glutathione S-transferase
MIAVSAFRWVPTFARGLVRDLRVRWALEEAGLPYEAWLIGPDDQKSERYRAMQPFGQVPAYEEDDLVLFESGAILLHIADRSEVLMPSDSKARARVTAWMLAALNSIEPHIQNLTAIDLFHAEEDWAKKRRPAAVKFAQRVWPRSPLARQSRLSGGSFHRGGPSDDDRAANSAAY